MVKEETIFIWDAIKDMRIRTSQERPFSFAHHTFNKKNRTSSGERYVSRALLRPAAASDDVNHAEFKLFYSDLSVNKTPRNCWQCLLSRYNDKRVTFKIPHK